MTDSVVQHAGLPHAVFLHRLAGESPSSALEPRLGRAAFVALRLVDLLGPEYTTLHPDAFHYQYVATARCCRDLPPGATERDRKSTRLNSSHGYISYAVFCLKKKKQDAVDHASRIAVHRVV